MIRKLLFFSVVCLLASVAHAQAFVQSATFAAPTVVSNSSYSAKFGSNVTSGHLVAVAFFWNAYSSPSVVSVTDSASNTYSVASTMSADGAFHGWIYYASEVTGGSALKVTVTVSQTTANAFQGVVLEYSGLSGLDGANNSSGAQTSNGLAVSSGSVTTTHASELILGMAISGCGPNSTCSSGSAVAGSGFTMRFSNSSAYSVEEKFVSSTGSYDGNFTLPYGCNCDWGAGVATFH